jgi:hypothetical protein
MASRTRAVSVEETPGSPLTTRDTVLRLTRARAATSRMVGRRLASPPAAAVTAAGVASSIPSSSRRAQRAMPSDQAGWPGRSPTENET